MNAGTPLQCALARAGHALATPRLRFVARRSLHGISGGVRLHYLIAPRGSATMHVDNRLTVRVLLAEARAARAISLHAYLLCMTAAREFVRHLRHRTERTMVFRGRKGMRLSAPRGRAGANGRETREALRDVAAHGSAGTVLRLLHTLLPVVGNATSQGSILATSRPTMGATSAALGGRSHEAATAITDETRARRSILAGSHSGRSSVRAVSAPMRQRSGHDATAIVDEAGSRRHILATSRHGRATVAAASAATRRRSSETTTAIADQAGSLKNILDTSRPGRTLMKTDAATIRLGHAGVPKATLQYRRAPRVAPPDTKAHIDQLRHKVIREVTRELKQNAPWRDPPEKLVLTPPVLHELTERVAGAIAGRQSLERYRRGL